MSEELAQAFRRNFPLAVREERTVRAILSDPQNRVIEKREGGRLVGVSVVRKNAILLLCVEETHRKKGIGGELLERAERCIREQGFHKAVVGAGDDYLTPGVPTSRHYYDAVNERLYPGLDESASAFFEKRGYRHGWDCNCFDMRFPLSQAPCGGPKVGDILNGVQYRWAAPEERDEVCRCVSDAWPEFAQWYRDQKLYTGERSQRVLAAFDGEQAVGALLVGVETEGKDLGSVGCTAVRRAWRGKHIAATMVKAGTRAVKDAGMKEAFLGYTYSGLDHLYGLAGYKICTYYMMAEKEL